MKLYYFDTPGRGEAIRLLLSHARVAFEDIRIRIADWPTMHKEFEGEVLPVLEINGQRYSQAKAILEFLGSRYGYLPLTADGVYHVVALMGAFDDFGQKLFSAYSPFSPYPEDLKRKKQTEFGLNDIPLFMSFLERRLTDNETPDFLYGSGYTLADFCALGFFRQLRLSADALMLFEDFKETPLTKAYLSRRLKDFVDYYQPSPHKPKLYYFDSVGRGEMIRLLLRHARVDFEDVRISYADWPRAKPGFALKQMPVWEVDGKQMPEADSIMWLLSLQHGYLPLDPELMYRVTFLVGTIKDLFEGFVRFFYGGFPEEKKKQLEDEYYAKAVPLLFSIIETRLAQNLSPFYLAGDQYTMADFYMLGVAKWLVLNPNTEKSYAPALAAAPKLSEYLKVRLSDFP